MQLIRTILKPVLGVCGAAVLGAVALGTAAPACSADVNITGAGSTFAYPMYSKMFAEYQKVDPSVHLNYQSIGSGGGMRQITEGTVDFGGTDGPMTEQQMAEFKSKRGCGILHLPTALGAVMPTYNIPGVDAELNFTPGALAGIYLGTITKWNDPAIATANPTVKLPDMDIVVMHRSDGSGTTYIWSDYLSKVSSEWASKAGTGTSLKWPVGLGGKGNEGVAGLVKQTAGSIGYVELIYAIQNKLSYGRVQNQAGKFIKADLETTSAAAAGAAKDMPADFRVSITNAPGENAYPIAGFTWIMVPEKISDPAKEKALTAFLKWAVTDGQEYLKPLAYAPLPKNVVHMELKAIKGIHD